MCKTYELTRNAVTEFISREKSFKFEDLRKEIINKSGSEILRVAPNYTVKEYLSSFEDEGKIRFEPATEKYVVII